MSVRVGVDADVEGCVSEQRAPQLQAGIVGIAHRVDRNVMYEHPAGGTAELLRGQLPAEKIHLFRPQSGKVVEAVVDPVVVGLVLPAVEHDDAGIAPVECSVGAVPYVVEKFAQADGVGVAYLMVASEVKYWDIGGSDGGVQLAEECRGLVVGGGVVDAVPVEDHEVVGNVPDVGVQGLKGFGMLVQVVEDEGGEVSAVI